MADNEIIVRNKPLENKWYLLYTSSRAEFKVAERLKLQGANIFFPTYFEKRKWSDRIKTIEFPLFRSYIFINCNEFQLRKFVLVPGVAHIVYYLGKPAIVREEEIEEVKKFLKVTEDSQIITEGDLVQILGGPFEKVYGKVTRIANKYIYLSLKSAGELTVCANLKIDRNLVKK